MKLLDEVRLVIKAVVFGTRVEGETTESRILRAIEHSEVIPTPPE